MSPMGSGHRSLCDALKLGFPTFASIQEKIALSAPSLIFASIA